MLFPRSQVYLTLKSLTKRIRGLTTVWQSLRWDHGFFFKLWLVPTLEKKKKTPACVFWSLTSSLLFFFHPKENWVACSALSVLATLVTLHSGITHNKASSLTDSVGCLSESRTNEEQKFGLWCCFFPFRWSRRAWMWQGTKTSTLK